jgi:membrane-associated phospholipid phosphatase
MLLLAGFVKLPMEFFWNIDRIVFYFCNHSVQNGLFDAVLPVVTDLNKHWYGIWLAAILWLFLLLRAGTPGRIAALLLIPTITFSDQLNSSLLKFLFVRPRPCHALPDVHLLVGCGSGYSFPSSHAVNTFAAALVLAYFLPRWTWAFFSFAIIVAFSRVYVGVHYPSDVLAGSIIGLLCGSLVILVFRTIERWWVARRRERGGSS